MLAFTCSLAATGAVLKDAPDAVATLMNQPISANALDNASVPPSTTTTVTGFTVEGSTKTHPADGSPVVLNDPVRGTPVGTIQMQPSGAYTFKPVPDYIGPVPALNLNLRCSNSQTAVSSLTIDVIPGEGGLLIGVDWLNRIR